MTNTLGIILEVLNNYPLSVRITGVIKRHFFLHGSACFLIIAISRKRLLQLTHGEL